MAGTAITSQSKPQSSFYALAQKISASDRLQRHDFAAIALNELIHVYEASYRNSLHEQPIEQQAQRKLARWRRGLSTFIEQLQAIENTINFTNKIEIIADQSGPIIIYIDDSPVVLSGPEIAKTSLIEKRITEQFCQLHDCVQFNNTPIQPPIQVKRVALGTWQFKQRHNVRYQTEDGLVFMFSTLGEREQKQIFCEAIAHDLRLMVSHLKRAQQSGYKIDWDRLSVSTLHDGKTEHIIINDSGDYLSLDLKSIGSRLPLNSLLLDWVKRQVAGGQSTIIISDSEAMWSQSKQP
ncbi:MAG: hypothetical protein OQL20_04160 [Sedimenticola sp.]|nr:hypothetical protein [Sedimenticola sp.]